MKKSFIVLLLFVACAGKMVTVTTPPPVVVVPVKEDTVHIIQTIHDTVTTIKTVEKTDTFTRLVAQYIHDTTYQAVSILSDTGANIITVSPVVGGDSYPELQAAINYQINNPGVKIKLNVGAFSISHPLLALKIVNGQYTQVSIDLEGIHYAKDAPFGYTSCIIPTYRNGFCIGTQQCKGCSIKNIAFRGQYTFPNHLTQIGIDTLTADEWDDGITSCGRTDPDAGIVVDFASDSTLYDGVTYKMYDGLHQYYLPGMSRGGSTSMNISGCSFYDFVVGILVTGGYNYNGELIQVDDNQIDHCKVAYAFSQAQSKANTLTRLMSWGGVRTICDGVNYGFWHSDGSCAPFIDEWNIAGGTFELLDCNSWTFPISIKRVYAESLFKIGSTGDQAQTHFEDCQIDFQNGIPGYPTPDFYVLGFGITFTDCMLRIYNGQPYFCRIVFNNRYSNFIRGVMSAPPITINQYNVPPHFESVYMYNWGNNSYINTPLDTMYSIDSAVIRIDRSSFNGYFLLSPKLTATSLLLGDVLLTTKVNSEGYITGGYGAPVSNPQTIIGFVTSLSGDTVKMQNMGQGFHDSDKVYISIDRIKPHI